MDEARTHMVTPHQKIMRAAKRGTGLRLTAAEVYSLSRDNAIESCARNDDDLDAELDEEERAKTK